MRRFLFLLLACSITLVGAPEAPPARDRSAPPRLINVNFEDEDLRSALRAVCDRYELPLVLPPELNGRLTLTARDVSWREILYVALNPRGYSYRLDGATVVVARTGEPVAPPADEEKRADFDFSDIPIATALRRIADDCELDFVIPDLRGRVSLKLRNVTGRQALKVVLEPIGYTTRERHRIIEVVRSAEVP